MSTKQAVMEWIGTLPEDSTWEDIVSVGEQQFGSFSRDSDRSEWLRAWTAECDRRRAKIQSGETVPIDGREMMKRLKEKYG